MFIGAIGGCISAERIRGINRGFRWNGRPFRPPGFCFRRIGFSRNPVRREQKPVSPPCFWLLRRFSPKGRDFFITGFFAFEPRNSKNELHKSFVQLVEAVVQLNESVAKVDESVVRVDFSVVESVFRKNQFAESRVPTDKRLVGPGESLVQSGESAGQSDKRQSGSGTGEEKIHSSRAGRKSALGFSRAATMSPE